ncbi:unnamed protein product, partial [Iphiclides podalirius]
MFRVVILFAAATIVAGGVTNVERCLNDNGDLPLHTYIEGCTDPPCELLHDEYVVMHTTFKAPRNITSMTTWGALYLNVGPVNVPVRYRLGEQETTCNFLENTRCPLRKGQIVRYTLRMYIGVYMLLRSAVRLEYIIMDENWAPVVCVGFPVRGDHYRPPVNQQRKLPPLPIRD